MHCPTLSELPSPPPGKTGWPWTEESLQMPDPMPNRSPWPRVSIVTPSFNQAQFIEETIRSVLLQGYSDLEYIIIDGGSTDGSVEIIRKYELWLAYWVSEKDRGQSHAINKGFRWSTGEVLAWLNSDDLYEPMALQGVVVAQKTHPSAVLHYGNFSVVDAAGTQIDKVPGAYTRQKLLEFWRGYYGIGQPASFYTRHLVETIGLIDDSLKYIMDYEFFLRAGAVGEFAFLDRSLARFRVHHASKTGSSIAYFAEEHVRVASKLGAIPELPNHSAYMGQVRRYYASTLVKSVLEGISFHGRHRTRVMAEALLNDPALLRQPWVWRLLVKCAIGSRWTEILEKARHTLSNAQPR